MFCRLFSILVLSIVTTCAYADVTAPKLTGIIKENATSKKYCSDVTNGICLMTQDKAIDYCISQENHLPSATELVQLSVSLGSRGLVDSCSGETDATCRQIATNFLNRKSDIIYHSYSNAGYKQPIGELGNHRIWSCTLDGRYLIPVRFDGADGRVYHSSSDMPSAVRCVLGPHSDNRPR